MATKDDIPVDVLRQLLRLDPDTGRLFWRERGAEWFSRDKDWKRWNTIHAGSEAFTASVDGYRKGQIFSSVYAAHRVVFALHHGRWPVGQVDHRDTDRGNNRPGNLREATNQQNQWNRGASKGAASRFCGVTWFRNTGKWLVRCRDAQGRVRHIGYFLDETAAARAYDAFAVVQHGEFARLNFHR